MVGALVRGGGSYCTSYPSLSPTPTTYHLPQVGGVSWCRGAIPTNPGAPLIAAAIAGTAAVPSPAFAAPQLKPCPPGVNNCYSTASGTIATWSWPKSSTKAQAIKDIEAVLDSYPQTGQAGVDGGGWSRAVDELVDNGYARFEFKSAGTGNLARFLNGGKPFTDDLEFAVEESGVCVRSSSRVGDSDFGVNKARLAFISAELKRLGWDAKGPSA